MGVYLVSVGAEEWFGDVEEVVSAVSRLTAGRITQSSDRRGLGDVGIVAVLEPEKAWGEHLWRMAASMYTNPPTAQTAARWILTQCTRARMCRAPAHRDLPEAKWTPSSTARSTSTTSAPTTTSSAWADSSSSSPRPDRPG